MMCIYCLPILYEIIQYLLQRYENNDARQYHLFWKMMKIEAIFTSHQIT